ncbi:MAG: double-strand break repair helicase AddA [Alphaproteobacteria bacterium]|nr:double-strand break repair helicase AddA [Alphaproteobacteria bacterium]
MTETPANTMQLRASDPRTSAWVNANAGSGKTHVLVSRVLRLMITGTQPSKIMCLTFTKAAAAEMANRLFDQLGAWVSMTDIELRQSLERLENVRSDEARLRRARQLFTLALETPGGLKIQTIHAFCERVLQLFPVEAGIVPRFSVMDDRLSAEILKAAQDRVFCQARSEPQTEVGKAVEDICGRMGANAFDEAIKELLKRRSNLDTVIASSAGRNEALDRLRCRLGLGAEETAESISRAMDLDVRTYKALAEALLVGSAKDGERSAFLLEVLERSAPSLNDLKSFYLTQKDLPRKASGIATKAVTTAAPWTGDFIAEEQRRLCEGLDKLANLERLSASRSLLTLGSEILTAFEIEKRHRGVYDFDDLILRTGALLREKPDAAWVLYKLDGGIEHLLVDEAQDTSPAQWHIIQALTEEFFAGAGRHEGAPRTVFAVGDRKQSIYSFQGADPDVFEAVHDDFARRAAAAGHDLRDVDFTVSFRSAPEILQAVDAVFGKQTLARTGLDGRSPRDWHHEPVRRQVQGLVEIWPLISPEDTEEPDPWTAPVDREPAHSPRRRLAAKLAQTIEDWIGKRLLSGGGRTVRPEDILILVRVRNGFFDALLRELRRRGIPVAGADRLKLSENIAILDLLALAQFCLLPEDDYSLACILKSPILALSLTEDELMTLAMGRGEKTLWRALLSRTEPIYAAAVAHLSRLVAIAPTARPYDFFASVLINSRLRFISRLGSEANDALDALLDQAQTFEDSHPATLGSFLNWFASGDIEIKRNMEQPAGEVRIMTVHGAKGLEAPIVILPDTVSMPDGRQLPPVLMVETGKAGEKLPMLSLNKLYASATVAELRDKAGSQQAHEYSRLLYVAMTRARDELYVCGYEGRQKPKDECWYNLIKNGLEGQMRLLSEEAGSRLGADPVFLGRDIPGPGKDEPLPAWVLSKPAGEAPVAEPVAISKLVRLPAAAMGADTRMARGLVIHRLLQVLPDLTAEARPAQALSMVRMAGCDDSLAHAILDILVHPDLAFIFAPDGLSEVPLLAHLPDLGLDVAGRIDRLLLSPEHVLAIDYKTGREVPAVADDAKPDDLAQMAAYRACLRRIHPGAAVEMALLYTAAPKLLRLPDALLDRAYDQIAVNRP